MNSPSPQTKSKSRPKKRNRSQVSAPGTARNKEKLTWNKKLKRWLAGFVATGLGISLLLHLLLLLGFSFYVFQNDLGNEFVLSSNMAPGDELLEFEEIVDVSLDVPEASKSPDHANLMTSQPTDLVAIPSFLNSESKGEVGESFGFRVPTGGKAVSKGSFTAWTVPHDPKPRQDYLLVIQIKLPEKIKRYRQEDLSGFLTGDDGYRTPIGDYKGSKFKKKYYGKFDMKAKQFVFRVPGGAEKVKDIIKIESKVLREKQQLEIVF